MPVSEKKFAVVTFKDENTCEMIPTCWMVTMNETKWPNTSSRSAITKLILECQPLSKNWIIVGVNVLSFTNSYGKAKRKAAEAVDNSNLSADSSDVVCSTQRKRQKPARYITDTPSSLSKQVGMNFEDESSGSESESVISVVKRHKIPSLPGNNVLRPNTSKYASNSQNPNLMEEVNSTNSTAFCNRIYQLLERINKRITDLSSEVSSLSSKVDKISSINSWSNAASLVSDDLPDGIDFPIKSIEDLHLINEKLKNDKELSATLVRFLYNSGYGRSERQFILSIVKRIMTQEIAVQFSRYGRKGKKSFVTYNEILNVILAAASMKFKGSQREDLAELFGKSLAGAKDWYKRQQRPSDVNSLTFTECEQENIPCD